MSAAETTLVLLGTGYATKCLMALIEYLEGGSHGRKKRSRPAR